MDVDVSAHFNESLYKKMRNDCQELTSELLDMLIMGQLQSVVVTATTAHTYKKAEDIQPFYVWRTEGIACRHKQKNPTALIHINTYMWICRQTFCFMYSIVKYRLYAIRQSLIDNGVTPRYERGNLQALKIILLNQH